MCGESEEGIDGNEGDSAGSEMVSAVRSLQKSEQPSLAVLTTTRGMHCIA